MSDGWQPRPDVVKVELRFYHLTADASAVTEALQMRPHKTQRAGSPTPFPELGPVPQHGWFFRTERLPKSTTLDDHISAITHPLIARIKEFESLREQGWEVELLLSWAGQGPGPVIPAARMAELGALGLALMLTVRL